MTRGPTPPRPPAAGPAGLVHGDLHPGNVLDGGPRGLVVIDPRPCVGDPAFDAVDWVLGTGAPACSTTASPSSAWTPSASCAGAGPSRSSSRSPASTGARATPGPSSSYGWRPFEDGPAETPRQRGRRDGPLGGGQDRAGATRGSGPGTRCCRRSRRSWTGRGRLRWGGARRGRCRPARRPGPR
ncbi:hypothetical protein CA984_14275 [Streptosporangium minutum]|uniref:Aminoglycoside phosphotransferase domain-containing protein n=1 Tax=Streptosporangium minutum TaxID=569862 RepID=A0A243RNT9_9ACTN|nr:hypothetical protein CA984_14275 [Streptosporangium minutum]